MSVNASPFVLCLCTSFHEDTNSKFLYDTPSWMMAAGLSHHGTHTGIRSCPNPKVSRVQGQSGPCIFHVLFPCTLFFFFNPSSSFQILLL